MRLLVFQHIAIEHPGIFRDFLKQDGIRWDAVELDEGQPIPDLRAYDALWVMGGPMDVWDVEDNPWLIPEKRAIRQWVRDLKRPFLGICLGHQLLADSVGGTCGPQRPPEVGIMEISLTEEGKRDPVFARQPHTAKALQWHGVRVAQPPEDAVVLASSPACHCSALAVCGWRANTGSRLPSSVSETSMMPTSGGRCGPQVPPTESASSWWPRQMPRNGRLSSRTHCRIARFSGISQGLSSTSHTSIGPPMTHSAS